MADGVKKINEWILKDGRVIGITKDISASKFEPGTFFINPSTGLLKYDSVDSVGNKSWKKFLPTVMFDEKTIERGLLADLIINESKLDNNSVVRNKIKDGEVVNSKLGIKSVTTEKIEDLHVTTEKLDNYAVTTSKIRDYQITESKYADESISTRTIRPLSIINTHIANKTIKGDKLFSKTVTNAEIKDLTVIESLLAPNAVTESKIKESAVKGKHVAVNSLETLHYIDRSVTGNKVAKNTLKDEHMMLNSINGDKLQDGSLGSSKMSDGAVINSKIQNKAVDMDKLDDITQTLIRESIRVDGTTNTATVGGNLKVNGNITATGNITGAKVFNPVFADIAEAYIPTMEVEVGDAVCLTPCGKLLVEPLRKGNEKMFIGFISDQYAACYGATPEELAEGEKVAVALTGRIPVKMNTKEFRVGDWIAIIDGEFIPVRYMGYSKPNQSVGRVLDIIDENHALVQV